MCMWPHNIHPYQKWHWAGDEIVPYTIIPASRTVPGTTKKRYPIDIREYLSIDENAVVKGEWRKLLNQQSPEIQNKLRSHLVGTFDLRARLVQDYMSSLRYIARKRDFDEWLFPDETSANGGGDCEDRAFLMAALLKASGISDYCIRVALGAIVGKEINTNKKVRGHHAWVVYLDEGGAWHILEPYVTQEHRKKGKVHTSHRLDARRTTSVEYIPHFVFNQRHLWRIRTPELDSTRKFDEYLQDRKFWKNFNPSFATGVHESIYDEALSDMAGDDLSNVKQYSMWADINVLAYDPRDHFDFAYIAEGWNWVNKRLSSGTLQDFAYAAHATADFYAHSMYSVFAEKDANGNLKLYDPAIGIPPSKLNYDFTKYAPLPGCESGSPAQAADHWKGKLVSGQWWRWYSTFPSKLKQAPDFGWRRCLPDHDRLAVDGPERGSDHLLFSEAEYPEAFRARRQAAVAHIRLVYSEWKAKFHP